QLLDEPQPPLPRRHPERAAHHVRGRVAGVAGEVHGAQHHLEHQTRLRHPASVVAQEPAHRRISVERACQREGELRDVFGRGLAHGGRGRPAAHFTTAPGCYQRLDESRENDRLPVGYWRRLTAIIMPITATMIPPSTTQSLQSLTTSVTTSASTTASMTTKSACIHRGKRKYSSS